MLDLQKIKGCISYESWRQSKISLIFSCYTTTPPMALHRRQCTDAGATNLDATGVNVTAVDAISVIATGGDAANIGTPPSILTSTMLISPRLVKSCQFLLSYVAAASGQPTRRIISLWNVSLKYIFFSFLFLFLSPSVSLNIRIRNCPQLAC